MEHLCSQHQQYKLSCILFQKKNVNLDDLFGPASPPGFLNTENLVCLLFILATSVAVVSLLPYGDCQ